MQISRYFFPIIFKLIICKLISVIGDLIDYSQVKALLIYTPQTDLHNNVVHHFAHILKDFFGIDVLMDVFDIPQTKHKNPALWCSEAFQQATHIVYITSPNTIETYPSVYKTEAIALRFLEEYLASGHSDKKLMYVTFPYSKRNIPELLRNFRHFHLMKDFSAFIYYLINCNKQNVFLCKSVFKRNQLLYYLEDPFYLDLLAAVEKAQKDAKLTKKRTKVKKPEIKILMPSEENIAAEREEEDGTDKLIKKEGECTFNIKELDLSGEKNDNLKGIESENTESFDIRCLDL